MDSDYYWTISILLITTENAKTSLFSSLFRGSLTNNIFKLGLPQSQDENAGLYLVPNLARHLELAGHLEK